jgi:hypothetical protein
VKAPSMPELRHCDGPGSPFFGSSGWFSVACVICVPEALYLWMCLRFLWHKVRPVSATRKPPPWSASLSVARPLAARTRTSSPFPTTLHVGADGKRMCPVHSLSHNGARHARRARGSGHLPVRKSCTPLPRPRSSSPYLPVARMMRATNPRARKCSVLRKVIAHPTGPAAARSFATRTSRYFVRRRHFFFLVSEHGKPAALVPQCPAQNRKDTRAGTPEPCRARDRPPAPKPGPNHCFWVAHHCHSSVV